MVNVVVLSYNGCGVKTDYWLGLEERVCHHLCNTTCL